MPEPQNGTELASVDHKAVRLRRYINLVVEEKRTFTLVRAIAADISTTGMRILCDQFLHPKTHYLFTMKEHPNLVVKGEVRWIRPGAPGMYQCGVLFIDLSAEDASRLERFLIMERERAVIASSPAAAIARPAVEALAPAALAPKTAAAG
jgi:hypothetical protein